MQSLHIELTDIYPTQLVMIGSHEALGWWDPSKGCKLEWNGEFWRTPKPINFILGNMADAQRSSIDYKFVRMIQGQCQWEAGPNRVLEIPAGATEFNVNAEFNGKGTVKVGVEDGVNELQKLEASELAKWTQEERRTEKTEEVLRTQLTELQLEISRMRDKIAKAKEVKAETLADIAAQEEAARQRKADEEARAARAEEAARLERIAEAARAKVRAEEARQEAKQAEEAARLERIAEAARAEVRAEEAKRAAETALAAKVAMAVQPLFGEERSSKAAVADEVTATTASSILRAFTDPPEECGPGMDAFCIHSPRDGDQASSASSVHGQGDQTSSAASTHGQGEHISSECSSNSQGEHVGSDCSTRCQLEGEPVSSAASQHGHGDQASSDQISAKCGAQCQGEAGVQSEGSTNSQGEQSGGGPAVRRRGQLRKTFDRGQRAMPCSLPPARADNSFDSRVGDKNWVESEPEALLHDGLTSMEAPKEDTEAVWALECLASARHRWHYIGDDPKGDEGQLEAAVGSEMLSGEVPALLRELRRLQHGYDEEANAAAAAEAIALARQEEIGRITLHCSEAHEEVCHLRASFASTEVALSMERLETADLRERVERLLVVMKEAEDNAAAADNRANKLYDEVQDAHQATADEVRARQNSVTKLNNELSLLAGDLDAMRNAYQAQVQRTNTVQAAADDLLEELRELHSRGLAADAEASQERDVAFAELRAAQDQLMNKELQMQAEKVEVKRLRGELEKQPTFRSEIMQLQACVNQASQERDAAIMQLRAVQDQLAAKTRDWEVESAQRARMQAELYNQTQMHEAAKASLEADLEAERHALAEVQQEKELLASEVGSLPDHDRTSRTLSKSSNSSFDDLRLSGDRSGTPSTPELPRNAKEEVSHNSVATKITGFQDKISAALRGQKSMRALVPEVPEQYNRYGSRRAFGDAISRPGSSEPSPRQPIHRSAPQPAEREESVHSSQSSSSSYQDGQGGVSMMDAEELALDWLLETSMATGMTVSVPDDVLAHLQKDIASGASMNWSSSSPRSPPSSTGSSSEDRTEGGHSKRPGPPGKPPLLPDRGSVPQRSRQRMYRLGMLGSNQGVLCQ